MIRTISIFFFFGQYVLSSQALAIPSYTITDIGAFEVNFSIGYGINDLGQVVGEADFTWASGHPYLWDITAGIQDLGKVGNISAGYAINNTGQVVGGGYPAFLWNRVNGLVNLNSLVNHTTDLELIEARDINDNGGVVGTARPKNDGQTQRAFLFNSGALINLGTLPGGLNSQAYGVNNENQVVGWSYTSSEGWEGRHAFVWNSGTMTDLGTLGGNWSMARAINDSGQIVGQSEISPHGFCRAFLWENGNMRDLGLPTGLNSDAFAVNNQGQIVGRYGWTPFLWDDGVTSKLIDLIPGDSGWETLLEARDINEMGQIVGMGIINGEKHAFILSPVPVPGPSTILLLGSGLVGLLGVRKHIRR